MSIEGFNKLSEERKHTILIELGVRLGERKTYSYYVTLHQISGFYVELFTNKFDKNIYWMKVFDSTNKLTPYLKEIDISKLLLIP